MTFDAMGSLGGAFEAFPELDTFEFVDDLNFIDERGLDVEDWTAGCQPTAPALDGGHENWSQGTRKGQLSAEQFHFHLEGDACDR